MSGYSRGVIWCNRLVLAVATFVMMMIAVRNLRDPIGATVPHDIALGSPTAVTIVRVGFGGFPLGFAMALFGSLIATRRLLTGVSLVLAVVSAKIDTSLTSRVRPPPCNASRAAWVITSKGQVASLDTPVKIQEDST